MLTVKNLTIRFNQTPVLHDISLSVKPGEIVGLIGPNGCGKTTFLNALSGFSKVESGSIVFNECEIKNWEPHHRAAQGIGRSFQHAGIFKEMTLEENLIIALELVEKLPWWWKFSRTQREKAQATTTTLLTSVGLAQKRHELAGMLSGGQLRLLELLRLRLSGGTLLLIDEPTAGVSPAMKQILAQQLRSLKSAHQSMIIVEHDLKFLFDIVDRVVVFVEGKFFLEGTPSEVVKNAQLREVYFGT